MKELILSILLGILDRVFIEPIYLNKLKDRNEIDKRLGRSRIGTIYEHDWCCGIFYGSLLWSILIFLPLLDTPPLYLGIGILINTVICCWFENKYWKRKLNLWQLYTSGLIQIIISWVLLK